MLAVWWSYLPFRKMRAACDTSASMFVCFVISTSSSDRHPLYVTCTIAESLWMKVWVRGKTSVAKGMKTAVCIYFIQQPSTSIAIGLREGLYRIQLAVKANTPWHHAMANIHRCCGGKETKRNQILGYISLLDLQCSGAPVRSTAATTANLR